MLMLLDHEENRLCYKHQLDVRCLQWTKAHKGRWDESLTSPTLWLWYLGKSKSHRNNNCIINNYRESESEPEQQVCVCVEYL